MINKNLNELTKIDLMKNEEFKINVDGLDVFLKVFLKPNNNKLVVFSNGAINRSKKTPPVYQRSTFQDSIQANCIFIDDRTIHEHNINTGWGFGTANRFYLKDYSKIIKKIANILSIIDADVTYYGSSAGGFMSIILATFHKESHALVNNPQIDLKRHFNPISVNALFTSVLPDKTRVEIFDTYSSRLNVVENMIVMDYVPNIVYLQNNLSGQDMRAHYNPFFQYLEESSLDQSSIQCFLYNNKKLGHNPLNKNTTEYFINTIVNKKLDF